MRGVHRKFWYRFCCAVGSSPHARGPPATSQPATGPARIIPACAGSTIARKAIAEAEKDHPRMRGVHVLGSGSRLCRSGSSPHARGPRSLISGRHSRTRIIPACAGSTRLRPWTLPPEQDHPRMRGVHRIHVIHLECEVGSSPHARGPQNALPCQSASCGIIPACAGSTVTLVGTIHIP